MTRGHVALALSLASCAAEPVQPPVSRRPAVEASRAPTRPDEPNEHAVRDLAPPPLAPHVDPAAFRGLALDAYRHLARGDEAAARDVFSRLASLARSVGSPLRAGLPSGRVVVGPTVSAHTGGYGTVFFEAGTGEPFAFSSDERVHHAVAGRDHAWFWVDDARGIYDARAGKRLELPGDAFAVNPVRPRAYVLDERCRLLEVELHSGEIVRTLGVLGRRQDGTSPLDPCAAFTYRDAVVTPDGRHLTTRLGRWNLQTGAFSALPTTSRGGVPAVSRDGRYIARLTSNPASRTFGDMTQIVLYDLDGGGARVSSWSTGPIMNGDPLWFEADPPRVCIFDYGHYIFHVPSLEPMAADDPLLLPPPVPYSFGAASCETRIAPSPEVSRATARFASRVCDVNGLPVPLRFCDGVAAP